MSRSKWKGPFVNLKNNINKNQHKKNTISRNSEIVPKFEGKLFLVHNGKNFSEINVTKDMIGHKFGEFSVTRAKFTFKKKKRKK